MGSGLSISRPAGRTNRRQSAQVQSPSMGYQFPDGSHPQVSSHNRGQLVVGIQPSRHSNTIGPAPALHFPLPVPENHKASTIKNDVNLKKWTLRLQKDEDNPGFYLVAFSFDAVVAGWICICFLAKEGEQCSLNTVKPHLYMPVRVHFEKGLGQNFLQASGTGVALSLLKECELLHEGNGEVIPLVVRMETIGSDHHQEERTDSPINASLPQWVHAQITHAFVENREEDFSVRAAKQIIYVDGVRYELQEIYGIENADGSNEGAQGNDCGKECVICLSELRDTTVLPCRHMCMCGRCARVLRLQCRCCPLCRAPVQRLLEIKVSDKGALRLNPNTLI